MMNKLRGKLAKFMYGRYGSDKLNMFLLVILLVCARMDIFLETAISACCLVPGSYF